MLNLYPWVEAGLSIDLDTTPMNAALSAADKGFKVFTG
jgi:hypothetical protein